MLGWWCVAVCAVVGPALALPTHRDHGALNSEQAGPALDLRVDASTGAWSVDIGGSTWFSGSAVSVSHSGVVFSNLPHADHPLALADASTFTGSDALGGFKATALSWDADGVSFVTVWREYASAVVFEQQFPDGLNDTGPGRANKDEVISAFPTIDVDDHNVAKGYLQLKGGMAGSGGHVGRYLTGSSGLSSGLQDTGPFIVFDPATANSAVWSVASSFMSVNQYYANNALSYGLMGSITSVPPGHSMSVILSVGSGINQGMFDWGAKLLRMYGKDRRYTDSDFGLNHLGYSTDNGAYYYYFTESGKNYEDTLIDLKEHVDSIGLPVRHILLDSWWYPKGPDGGVTTWEPMASIFPHGLGFLYNKTQWPAVAHNRYWSNYTTYAKQNGGQWDFIVENDNHLAIPTEQEFWDHLMQASKQWGLMTYEQDWLYNEFEGLNATLTSPTMARQWLMQMGAAAQRNGLTIQYCMSWCRHMLQSVEIPVVTQARASGDYHPGNLQWNLAFSSMFVHSIGVRPSKDNWWSTREESWKNAGVDRETHNRLQGAVAILSTGPYTPADMIGGFDVDLIMKGAMQDGTLLQPDRPLTPLDANVVHMADSSWDGPDGLVQSTTSTISGLTYHYVLSVGNSRYSLKPSALGVGDGQYLAFEANATSTVQPFSAASPVVLSPAPSTSLWDFNLWTFAPLLPNGWAVVGETSKWVAASSDRFVSVFSSSSPTSQVRVRVRGFPGETVTLGFVAPGATSVQSVSCEVSEQGSVEVVMPSQACNAV